MPDIWKLNDKSFNKFILDEDIQEKVCELAARINSDLAGKKATFIVVLEWRIYFRIRLAEKSNHRL